MVVVAFSAVVVVVVVNTIVVTGSNVRDVASSNGYGGRASGLQLLEKENGVSDLNGNGLEGGENR